MTRSFLALAWIASLAACPRDGDDGSPDAGVDYGIVQLDGGPLDGRWILDGTFPCAGEAEPCVLLGNASGMDLRGADYLSGTYDGELREDGPGVATIALDEGGPDGGALEVFRWPSVVGHRFASPVVGDRVRLRVEPWFLGESEAVPYVELSSASGRLLVAQFDIGAGSGLLEVTERPAGPSCSWSTAEPQCCCTADADVLVTVHADTPVDLGRCSEAIVTVDSAPLYVRVEHAVRRTQSDCGDDGWLLDARALAVALAE